MVSADVVNREVFALDIEERNVFARYFDELAPTGRKIGHRCDFHEAHGGLLASRIDDRNNAHDQCDDNDADEDVSKHLIHPQR